ncbi:site-specific integrase [Crossiella sp. SN42]|uniref:tyrosine-type recombinase/integrase n=1 Tax=Crossiella sp. SN42 TaxID=2944808 RepID=UPI00207C4494|nr:tyrosine-type recombinase/integrase [Crossiella sp. SN42]MCO1574981.1 site-specific integrase [Crossiella sp. SN42]
MASVEEMTPGKNGKRRWRAVWRDSAGNKQNSKAPYFDREGDAKRYANAEEDKARKQAARVQGTLPATTKWGVWWDLLAPKRVSASDTSITERYIVEGHIRPVWGEVPLNQISNAAVRNWVEDLSSKYSPGYVHRIFSVFNVSIKRALKEPILVASPCVDVGLPKRSKRPKAYLSVSRAEKVKGKISKGYEDAIDLGMETGLRPGELCGLHIHRVNREEGYLEVEEVRVRRKRLIKPVPKDHDTRKIWLTSKGMEIVDRQLDGRDPTRGCGIPHADGNPCPSDVLLRTRRDRPLDPGTLGYHIRNALKALGLATMGGYGLRRGAFTKLAAGGLNPFRLARMAGWKDINLANEYVQETEDERAAFLAAAGDPQALRVLPGGAELGTGSGTTPDLQPLKAAEGTSDRKTG